MCGVSSGEQGSLVARGGHSFPFSGDKCHAVTTKELYGPWMVAGDRKRRPRKQLATDKGMNLTTGKSRFDVLATEVAAADVPEVGDLISSVAHVSTKAGTSVNNDKRENVQDDQSSTHVVIDTELRDVVVESMVPGRTPLVIGSNPGLKGRHKAVTIVDDGFDLEGGKRGGFKKGSSSMGKLRLQVRKQSVFKAPNLSRLSEWIDTLPSREGADKQSPVVSTSASAQADPPDPIAPFQNIHGNGPGGRHDDSEMVQVGAGSPAFRGHFKRVLRESSPALIALFEPRINGNRATTVIRRLGLPNSFRVEAHGFSWGLWILWKPELDVQFLSISNQFVHMKISFSSNELPVFITAVYASPCASVRRFVWDKLRCLDPGPDHAWLLGGDFNAIYNSEDRMGGSRSRLGVSHAMKNFVFETGLVDVRFRGIRFTWKRGSLSQRLDRCLANERWLDRFPTSVVLHLDRLGSDHRPILLDTNIGGVRHVERPFRFVFAWQEHMEFKDVLLRTWDKNKSVIENLQFCRENLSCWNSTTFGHIGQKKRRLIARLHGIDNYLSSKPSAYLSALEKSLKDELDVILEQEESLWMQKSRCRWFSEGDRNTRYFHACAKSIRRSNTILGLRSKDGTWCEDQLGLRQISAELDSDNTFQRGYRLMEESLRARQIVRRGRSAIVAQTRTMGHWIAPPEHWIKINTDGARSITSGLASCGGVGRDFSGTWCFGFSRDLGLCSVLEAELWGVYEGLTTAWSLGYPRVIVEMDCRDAYDMLVHGNPRHLGSSLLPGILELQQRCWEIQFRFTCREGNIPADIMSRLVQKGTLAYHRYLDPPLTVRDALDADKRSLLTN
ncbi:hypothetical protein GQ457_05G016360 [Hibiscus cannabinus]